MRDLDRFERAELQGLLMKTSELVMSVIVAGHAATDPWWADWAGDFLSGYEVGHSEVEAYVPDCAELYHKVVTSLTKPGSRGGTKSNKSVKLLLRDAALRAATNVLAVEKYLARDLDIKTHLSEAKDALSQGFALLNLAALR